MVIAITGSGGFIGSAVRERLASLPNIHILDLNRSNGFDIMAKERLLQEVPAFDLMIHLAARVFVPDSYSTPYDFYQVNILGTLNVLELCKKHHAPIIYLSSYVYGVPEYLPIDEKHPVSGFNPYAGSKLAAEDLCKLYARFHEVPCTIVRLFNVYGPNQPEHFLIARIIEGAKKGRIELQSSKPKRDYVHMSDLTSFFEKLVNSESSDALRIFNLGSGQSFSPRNIVDMVLEFLPTKEVYFSEIERPHEVMDTRCDTSLVMQKLNWQPSISLEKGIADLCL